jgi:hypothetical protein
MSTIRSTKHSPTQTAQAQDEKGSTKRAKLGRATGLSYPKARSAISRRRSSLANDRGRGGRIGQRGSGIGSVQAWGKKKKPRVKTDLRQRPNRMQISAADRATAAEGNSNQQQSQSNTAGISHQRRTARGRESSGTGCARPCSKRTKNK